MSVLCRLIFAAALVTGNLFSYFDVPSGSSISGTEVIIIVVIIIILAVHDSVRLFSILSGCCAFGWLLLIGIKHTTKDTSDASSSVVDDDNDDDNDDGDDCKSAVFFWVNDFLLFQVRCYVY